MVELKASSVTTLIHLEFSWHPVHPPKFECLLPYVGAFQSSACHVDGADCHRAAAYDQLTSEQVLRLNQGMSVGVWCFDIPLAQAQSTLDHNGILRFQFLYSSVLALQVYAGSVNLLRGCF